MSSVSTTNVVTTEFLGFATDATISETLQTVAVARGWSPENVLRGRVEDAIKALSNVPTPSTLIVDLSLSIDVMSDVTGLADVCDPGANVIIIGAQNDIQLYRDLMDFGVADYLVTPIAPSDVEAALVKLEKITAPVEVSETQPKSGTTTAIIGVHGGVGATTIAVNSAWLLAHEFNRDVALVDLDQHFGSVTLALDLEPGTGLSEALANPGRIDDLFIDRAMVRESDHLMVLGSEETIERGKGFKTDAFEVLAEKLCSKFNEIVIDLPLHLAVSHPEVWTYCDRIIVVTDLSLAGLRDTKQLVTAISNVAPSVPFKVLANQVGRFKKSEVALQDFEHGSGQEVAYSVPIDAKGVIEAAIVGKALAETGKQGLAIKAIRQMTRELFEVELPEKTNLFAKLMRK